MHFSGEARNRNDASYAAIRDMPFNRELAAGTLPRTTFQHYIVQDAHYLVGFARALAMAAAKAPEPERVVEFCEAAREAIVVERSLHGSFLAEWGIDAGTFAATPVSPACHHYVSYLVATAFAEPYEIVLAALLPCFAVYAEVGQDIQTRAAADNPYRAWIDTYGGDQFADAVARVAGATDAAAAAASPGRRDAMHAAYAAAVQLEFLFWQGAYDGIAWPL